MFEKIISEKNQKIKYLKKLYSKRGRREKGKLVLEGYRIIEEALKSDTVFEQMYMSPDFFNSSEGQFLKEKFLNKENTGNILIVDKKILDKIADTVSPQGVIAVVNEIKYETGDLFKEKGLLLLLDRIQDPGNMGTIIRTAVAAGLDGIIILKGSVDIYNQKVLRATMGAVFKIPLLQGLALEEFFELMDRSNYRLLCTDLTAERYYYQEEYKRPLIIAIGNEANGLDERLLQRSDYRVKIPITDRIESLNAAVAAGVIIYKLTEREWK